jgi:hypothetical protein
MADFTKQAVDFFNERRDYYLFHRRIMTALAGL